MGRTSWFDEQHNELEFEQYVEQMESWQAALADGIVTPEEVHQQTVRVANLLRELEPKLSDEIHAKLTVIFRELAVLYGMERIAEIQLEEEA